MSIARQVAPELPALRRFARLISGSQASGDAHVVAALEALTADPTAFPGGLTAREGLYKVFLKLWNSSAGRLPPGRFDASPRSAPERNLEAITPLPRQVFLLRVVEEFPVSEIAAIFSTFPPTRSPRRSSGRAARSPNRSQPTSSSSRTSRSSPWTSRRWCANSATGSPASPAPTRRRSRACRLDNPGLVLADIHLADGSSGLDAVNEILASINVPVIFITAYPERLLTGEKPEPAFLITKPFKAGDGARDDQPGAVLRSPRRRAARACHGRPLRRAPRGAHAGTDEPGKLRLAPIWRNTT